MSPPESPPNLSALLSKLRPFQRTAFEFAVRGALPEGGGAGGGPARRTSSHDAARAPRGGENESRSGTRVAGAGTGRILLGDEMGLGKTLTSLAIMSAYQPTEWPLLILCPASLRYTWPTEIEKWLPWVGSQTIHVVRGADDVHFAAEIQRWRKQQRETAEERGTTKKCPVQIVIVTYSLLQNRFQIANVLRECEFQCIIADESHNLKQLASQRCQLALPLLHGSKRLVLLSGTPALNRPVELWPQLHALDAKGRLFNEGAGMSYTAYTQRYCNARRTRFGYDVKGVSHADELHGCLTAVMVRRLKSDVLQDLPPKQRSIVPVTILEKAKERESRDLMTQLGQARQAASNITAADADDVATAAQWEARKLLMRAYQASGVAKAPATAEFVLDWLEGSDATQKLIVFAHHKEVLDYIEATLARKHKGRLGMMRIDGSVPPAERALRVKKFQSNKKVRVAILSMTAAGVGLTLTAASNIVFAELHWTPGVLAQAEDRCHRIGQANSVNVMYCICKDEEVSVDTSLWSMLARKVGNLGRVVDGERGKGLDAVESNAHVPSNEKQNVSVTEELSSFFASNVSSRQKEKKGPAVVVRGSIQSFFTKQAKKSAPATKKPSSATQEKTPKLKVNADCISLLDEGEDEGRINVTQKRKPVARKSLFFSQKKHPKSKAKTACISLLDEDSTDNGDEEDKQKPTEKRTQLESVSKTTTTYCPSGTRPPADGQTELKSAPLTGEWSCSVCTYINQIKMKFCSMCQNKRKFENDEHKVNERMMSKEDRGGKLADTDRNLNEGSICKEFEEDVEWDEKDLATIDAMTQSQTQVSQSVSPSSTTQSPANLQDGMSRECSLERRPSQTDLLGFSVSRNSGRVALHLLASGQPLHVNFDISQVLSKESADGLEETHLSRKVANSTSSQSEQEVSFNDGAVREVLAALDDDAIIAATLSPQECLHLMCEELKQFVRSYLGLREVEKKAVKESGEAIAASLLEQTVAKILFSTVTGSTERYLGGAKERAILNVKNNCSTATDEAVLNGQACIWCAKPFLCSSGAHYCSQTCAEEGRLRRGGIFSSTRIREALFALEHGRCTMCGLDAHSLFRKIKVLHPAERLNALLNAKWRLPQTRQATDRLLNDPREPDFWQADHTIAVAEGGGSTGLDNLRTLCTPCHGSETEKLFGRLKTMPASQTDEPKGGLTQMDITACFSKMNDDKSSGTTKRKKRRRVAD